MSSVDCGNCDCPDKSQCKKQGNKYGVEIIQVAMPLEHEEAVQPEVAENSGCRCVPTCQCSPCTCT